MRQGQDRKTRGTQYTKINGVRMLSEHTLVMHLPMVSIDKFSTSLRVPIFRKELSVCP